MPRRWFSVVTSIVIAGAGLFFCLTWWGGHAAAGRGHANPSFPVPADRLEGAIVQPRSRSANDQWVIECVDCPPNAGSVIGNHVAATSLAVDSEGYPHVVLHLDPDDDLTGDLHYGFLDAAGWHFEEVRRGVAVWESSVSLVLDQHGNPRIGYASHYGDGVWYAYRESGEGGWHFESVDSLGFYASLALDGKGNPHMSYQQNGTTWTYAYREAGVWHTEPLAEFGYFAASHTSIAVDGSGHMHVGCNGDLAGDGIYQYDLWYAAYDGTNWYTDTADTDIGWHSRLSLKVDDGGHPQIAYRHSDEQELRHAHLDVSGWHTVTVDSEGLAGFYPSLALDGNGYPHVAYYDNTNDDLKLAYQDASGWHTQTLDSQGDVGQHTSLDVDDDGYPHVAYYDGTNDQISYAYQDLTGWHIEAGFLEPDGYVGLHTSLALDDSGYPHVSYYDWSAGDLKYAYRDVSGWHSQTVDGTGDVGSYTSLALAGDGYPRISYYDVTHGDLKYAYRNATGWHSQTVDAAGDVGEYTSLALDPTAPYTPHISYYDATNQHPKYAHLGATGWHSQTVGTAYPAGQYTALALGSNGYPHISYYCQHFGDLRYTRQVTSAGWMESVVAYYGDPWNEVGRYSSLALDTLGNPYISYFDEFVGALRVAAGQAPLGWSTMWTVDSGSFLDTSLTMDGGYGHVSYYDTLNGALNYAYQDASGWHVRAVDSDGNVGQYSSIALDGGGHPHISYYDADRSNLKLAYTTDRPIAAFTAAPTIGFAPLVVRFTNNSSGNYDTSLWEFGDGLTSTSEGPTHTYTTTGTHTVTLTVSGPGGTDALTRQAYVTVHEPVRAGFTANPVQGVSPLVVAFAESSTGPVTAWRWDFGDGGVSALRHPVHTYTMPGVYTVALTARASEALAALPGGTGTLTRAHYIIASEPPPQVDFRGSPRIGDTPLTVQFTSTVTGTLTDYDWDFGDGGVADSPHPTHTYRSAGIFGVTLIVTGPGGTANVWRPDYITANAPPAAPTAAFSADMVSGTAPLSVTFTAVTTGTVEHWLWSFGDGDAAFIGPVVNHTYVASGTFDVGLTVSNTHGSFVASKPHYIAVRTAGEALRVVYLPLVLRSGH